MLFLIAWSPSKLGDQETQKINMVVSSLSSCVFVFFLLLVVYIYIYIYIYNFPTLFFLLFWSDLVEQELSCWRCSEVTIFWEREGEGKKEMSVRPLCFCVVKLFLKKFKFFFLYFKLIFFLVFFDHFDALMLKIIFKK